MASYEASLVLDFGSVGYHNDKHPFKVCLVADLLVGLIRDARNASRVYELMLICRPGDIWDYVSVVPLDLPPRLAARVALLGKKVDSVEMGSQVPPAQGIPFSAFDRRFSWLGDDTEPEAEAWLNQRDSPAMRSPRKCSATHSMVPRIGLMPAAMMPGVARCLTVIWLPAKRALATPPTPLRSPCGQGRASMCSADVWTWRSRRSSG